ncbi:hypothetical protein U1Q18_016307 [Sarracenia purpurea var. burkii]
MSDRKLFGGGRWCQMRVVKDHQIRKQMVGPQVPKKINCIWILSCIGGQDLVEEGLTVVNDIVRDEGLAMFKGSAS